MSISGNLRTMPFADLLQWVSQSRKTGTLSVEGDPHNKKIYFRNGLVAAASSENPKEFLGYYLVGWEIIGEEEMSHARPGHAVPAFAPIQAHWPTAPACES